jgi:hypothetical protein
MLYLHGSSGGDFLAEGANLNPDNVGNGPASSAPNSPGAAPWITAWIASATTSAAAASTRGQRDRGEDNTQASELKLHF